MSANADARTFGTARQVVQAEHKPFARDRVDRILNEAFNWQAVNVRVSKANIAALTARLSDELPPEHLEQAFAIACKRLKRAERKQRWTIEALPQFAKIVRSPSPIVRLRIKENPVPDLENQLVHNLTLPATKEASAGQILMSAIIFGAFIDRRWWTALIQAVGKPERHVTLANGRLCIFLEQEAAARRGRRPRRKMPGSTGAGALPDRHDTADHDGNLESGSAGPKAAKRTKFWVADALTECLIRRANHAGFNFDGITSDVALIAFHGQAQLSEKQLARAASDHLQLLLPPALINYAAGRLASTDAAPETLAQLITNRPLVAPDPASEDTAAILTSAAPPAPRTVNKATAPPKRQYHSLRAAMGKSATPQKPKRWEVAKKIEGFIAAQAGGLHPLIVDLAHWCLSMLRGGRGTGAKPYALNTVKSYLSSIGPALLDRVLTRDLTSFSTPELEILYDDIVTQPNLADAERGRRSVALGLFHASLMALHPDVVGPVETSFIGGGTAIVDANLVTSHAYHEALLLLSSPAHVTDILARRPYWLRCLALILGYRAGLRWSEASLLALNEFVWTGDELELHIRNNQQRDVKSDAGHRILPLGKWLTPDEHNLLRGVWRLRETESPAKSGEPNTALLFATPAGGQVHPDDLFNPIQAALRRASGNPAATFHHCRHAFGSRLTAMLLLPSATQVWEELPGLGLTETWPTIPTPEGKTADEILEPRRPYSEAVAATREWVIGKTPCDRQVLHAVSQLIGHESPGTTLQSYVHIMAWVLAARMDQKLIFRLPSVWELGSLWVGEASERTLFRRQGNGDYDSEALASRAFLQDCLNKWRRRSPASQSPILPATRPKRGRPPTRKKLSRRVSGQFPSAKEICAILTAEKPTSSVKINDVMFTVAQLRALAGKAVERNSATKKRLDGIDLPNHAGEQQAFAQIWDRIAATGQFRTPKHFQGLSTFWKNYRDDRSVMLDANPEKRKLFIDFIKELGVSASRIQAVYYAPRDLKPEEHKKRLAEIEGELGLKKGNCIIGKPGRGKAGSTCIRILSVARANQAAEVSTGFLTACLLLFVAGTWQKAAQTPA